jgi:hypothetical protein
MLQVTRRDDKVFTFYFYDDTGAALNLTGCALYTTIKQNPDDVDASAKYSGTLTISTPATAGIAVWTISKTDLQYLSGVYYWDVQLKDGSGNITTVINDFIEVKKDVTIRTTA